MTFCGSDEGGRKHDKNGSFRETFLKSRNNDIMKNPLGGFKLKNQSID